MPVQTGTWQAGGVWDAVAGRVFTDALNEGLARAAASRAHAPAGRGGGRDTPFVAAVLSAFEARLPAAPTRAQKGGAQEDGKAQKDGAQEDGTQPPPALLVRHARWSLLAALGPGVPPPVAGGLSAGHQAMVLTLLLECLVLVLLEAAPEPDPGHQPGSAVRELGRAAREALARAEGVRAPGPPITGPLTRDGDGRISPPVG
ncbi:hypothetical protein [Streptomyces cyaneofuscatus]|uniref:hypothetical protein n=1 Tax=Streptomyces cyaneofuscatus TaxID=66883 RepID=UPI0033B94394